MFLWHLKLFNGFDCNLKNNLSSKKFINVLSVQKKVQIPALEL